MIEENMSVDQALPSPSHLSPQKYLISKRFLNLNSNLWKLVSVILCDFDTFCKNRVNFERSQEVTTLVLRVLNEKVVADHSAPGIGAIFEN